MKLMSISLEDAKARHGDLILAMQGQARKKLARSKSPNKGNDISELVWEYVYSVDAHAMNVGDWMTELKSRVRRDQAWASLTVEQKVADELGRTTMMLCASMPGARVVEQVTVFPPEYAIRLRERYEQDAERMRQCAAGTDDERAANMLQLIEELWFHTVKE
jgi:hypothetical protein